MTQANNKKSSIFTRPAYTTRQGAATNNPVLDGSGSACRGREPRRDLLAVAATLVIAGPWMMTTMLDYLRQTLLHVATLGVG